MTEDEKKELSRQRIRASAVGLTDSIQSHKVLFGEDMTDEILDYFKEKTGG